MAFKNVSIVKTQSKSDWCEWTEKKKRCNKNATVNVTSNDGVEYGIMVCNRHTRQAEKIAYQYATRKVEVTTGKHSTLLTVLYNLASGLKVEYLTEGEKLILAHYYGQDWKSILFPAMNVQVKTLEQLFKKCVHVWIPFTSTITYDGNKQSGLKTEFVKCLHCKETQKL